MDRVQRDLPLHVLWLVFLIGAAVLLVSEKPSLPFLNEPTLFVALIEIQLAFVLLIWPLWLARSLKEAPDSRRALIQASVQLGIMFSLAFPVNLIGQAISNTPAPDFFRACGIFFATQVLVGTLYVLGARLRLNLFPYYFLGVFVSQAVLPFMGYLLLEFSNTESLDVLKLFSPFWMIASSGGAAVLQSVVLVAAAVILGVAAFRVKPIEPAAPAQ